MVMIYGDQDQLDKMSDNESEKKYLEKSQP